MMFTESLLSPRQQAGGNFRISALGRKSDIANLSCQEHSLYVSTTPHGLFQFLKIRILESLNSSNEPHDFLFTNF
jgi:hypothetical protein